MSKSILVIDTPENCEKCPFCRGWNVCKIMKYLNGEKIISIYTVDHQIFEENKPDWCPLRGLPEKKEENKYHNSYEKGKVDGFNACIDEILKGDDENERNSTD